jgi:hypothetical protein
MGTWGISLFSDDTACDVRDSYREYLEDGLSAEEASAKTIEEYRSSLDDPDEATIFWMALAASQWKLGRLQDDVQEKALAVIEAGADLQQWREEAPKQVKKREQALEKLRQQLLSPQKKPTRIRKAYHEWTDWEIGHAISYRLLSGRFVIFRVVAHDIYKDKSRKAIVETCDWVGDQIPEPSIIEKMPAKPDRRWKGMPDKMALYGHSKRDYPADRLAVVATGLSVVETDTIGACYFGGWRKLDEHLKSDFGLE